MSDYSEDLEILARESVALTERENALYTARGVPEGEPLIATEGDVAVQTMLRERNQHSARMLALFDHYNQPGVDPHTVARPDDPNGCTWLPKE